MKLINDWKNAYRMWSVQCMAVAGAINGALLVVPEWVQQHLPSGLLTVLSTGALALGIVARIIDQNLPTPQTPSQSPEVDNG